VRSLQIENMIAKHKMKQEVIAGGHGKGSRRFTVQHNPEESCKEDFVVVVVVVVVGFLLAGNLIVF